MPEKNLMCCNQMVTIR